MLARVAAAGLPQRLACWTVPTVGDTGARSAIPRCPLPPGLLCHHEYCVFLLGPCQRPLPPTSLARLRSAVGYRWVFSRGMLRGASRDRDSRERGRIQRGLRLWTRSVWISWIELHSGFEVLLAIPALTPGESSELVIAPGVPEEVGVGVGVGSTVVGVTEMDNEVTTVDEDDSGTEAVVVMEMVILVGVVLPSVCVVCVVMVEISVVVTRVEVRVAGGITTVVGGGTEIIVVVTEEVGCVDFEESGCFLLPSSSKHAVLE